MLTLIAHVGHWAVQAVYFLPVIAFMVWLGVSQYKLRKENGSDDSGNPPDVR